jgi:hypothetical protein
MESQSKDEAIQTGRKRRAKKAYTILAVVAVLVGGGWYLHCPCP